MSYMRHIPVKNKELIKILDKYRELIDMPGWQEKAKCSCEDQYERRDWWVGHEYLSKIQSGEIKQDGFPDSMIAYDMAIHRHPEHTVFRTGDAQFRLDVTKRVGEIYDEIMEWTGAKYHALTALYPPGGYISWHSNANAPGYNLIITWSETGDGYFEYVDPTTKEVVRVQDKPGWQCKAAYFGSWDEPDKIFYHAASADCWRITVSFIFSMDDAGQLLREELIEDIMTE